MNTAIIILAIIGYLAGVTAVAWSIQNTSRSLIKEISKISLGDGDVVVIRPDPRSPIGNVSKLMNELIKIFPRNNVILAMQGDSFEIIKQRMLDEN